MANNNPYASMPPVDQQLGLPEPKIPEPQSPAGVPGNPYVSMPEETGQPQEKKSEGIISTGGNMDQMIHDLDVQSAQEEGASGTPWDAKKRALLQGITFGYSDEAAGAGAAAAAALLGKNWRQAYANERDAQRAYQEALQKAYPGYYGGGLLIGAAPVAIATPSSSIPRLIGDAGAQGALFSGGTSDKTGSGLLADMALGGAFGAGTAGVFGTLGKAAASTTPSGIARNTIESGAQQDLADLARNIPVDVAPGETSPVLSDILKTASASAPSEASAAIPGATQRMADVNSNTISDINSALGSDNATLLAKQIKTAASAANNANYTTAYAEPVSVGLLPDLTSKPIFKKALGIAQDVASNETPPREIDVTNMSTKDLDIIKRVLDASVQSAKASAGDTSTAAIAAKANLPETQNALATVKNVATQMNSKYGTALNDAEQAFKRLDALESGTSALSPAKEATEVASEFSSLSPLEQEAYRSGMATKLRAMLASKSAKANPAILFEKTGLADKLAAVGMPQDQISQIIERGNGARAVLNALTGGSDTARKLMAAEAAKSPLSKVTPMDLLTAKFINPVTGVVLPFTRWLGEQAERGAAGDVVKALAYPGTAGIESIISRSPQTYTPSIVKASGLAGATALPGLAGATRE